jgi:hypothetical protein
MSLAMTVFSVVLGVTVVVAIFGILIDRAASHEHKEGR